MCFTLQKVQEAAGTVLYCTVHEFYTVVRYFTLIYNSIRRQQGTKQKCTNNLHIDLQQYQWVAGTVLYCAYVIHRDPIAYFKAGQGIVLYFT